MTTTAAPTLDVSAVRALGSDLLIELSHAAGDEEAVAAIRNRWLEVLDTTVLLVTAAALQEAFTACVVMVLPTEGDAA